MTSRIVQYLTTDPGEADYRHLAVRFEGGVPVASAGSQTAAGALAKLDGRDLPKPTPEPAETVDDIGVVL